MTNQSDALDPWQMPSPRKLLDAIETWRQIDLRLATDEDVRKSLRALLDTIEYFATVRLNVQGLQTVYRARFASGPRAAAAPWPWTSDSALLCPPSERAQRQRCNKPGEPVLYCARDIVTCLREMRAAVGDQVVLASYKVRGASLAVVVPKNKTNALDGRAIFDNDGAISFLIFREFVRSEFTKPVGAGTEFLYKLSSALCEVVFDDADNDGWLYPSVESPMHECLAFKPRFVDSDGFALWTAERFDILGEVDRSFVAQRTQKATIQEHSITWEATKDPAQWFAAERRAGDPPLVWPLPGGHSPS